MNITKELKQRKLGGGVTMNIINILNQFTRIKSDKIVVVSPFMRGNFGYYPVRGEQVDIDLLNIDGDNFMRKNKLWL